MVDIRFKAKELRDRFKTSTFDPIAKYKHLIGQRFGKLVVKSILPECNAEGKSMAHCVCDCDGTIHREKDLRITHLIHGLVKSCGQCGYGAKVTSERSSLDLAGKKFGDLTVVRRTDIKNFKNVMWECRCPKGHTVYISATRLANGKATHCHLCRRSENYDPNKYIPMDKKPIREVIAMARSRMINRCHNPKDPSYIHYGARGITVCDEWRDPEHGLDSFYNWSIAHGWKRKLTIDRYPNKMGPYAPDNCRWTTMRVQNNNRTNNRIINVLGISRTIAEWARELEISPERLYHFSDDKVKTCVGMLIEAKKTLGEDYYELIKRRIF